MKYLFFCLSLFSITGFAVESTSPLCRTLPECTKLLDQIVENRTKFDLTTKSFVELSDARVSIHEAQNICKSQNMQLPDARDLARFAMSRGAKGFVGGCRSNERSCFEVKTMKSDGSPDWFYFNASGYRQLYSPIIEKIYWSSSLVDGGESQWRRMYIFRGTSGNFHPEGFEYGSETKRSVLCVSERPPSASISSINSVCSSLENCQNLYNQVQKRKNELLHRLSPGNLGIANDKIRSFDEAEQHCAKYHNARLPTAREFAYFAMGQGARGLVMSCDGDPTCSEISSLDSNGNIDAFLFSYDGYQTAWRYRQGLWTASTMNEPLESPFRNSKWVFQLTTGRFEVSKSYDLGPDHPNFGPGLSCIQ